MPATTRQESSLADALDERLHHKGSGKMPPLSWTASIHWGWRNLDRDQFCASATSKRTRFLRQAPCREQYTNQSERAQNCCDASWIRQKPYSHHYCTRQRAHQEGTRLRTELFFSLHLLFIWPSKEEFMPCPKNGEQHARRRQGTKLCPHNCRVWATQT